MYTLDKLEGFVNCSAQEYRRQVKSSHVTSNKLHPLRTWEEAEKNHWNSFLESQPHEDDYFHLPMAADETSKVSRNILLDRVLGNGSEADPCFVIMSIPSRLHLAKRLVDQLIAVGASGRALVVKGVSPRQVNTSDAHASRSVVATGWRDHALPILHREGGNRLYIFFEDDAFLCIEDINHFNEFLKDAQQSPIAWLGYNNGGGWGAQSWSLWGSALPTMHRYLIFNTGSHFDHVLVRMMAPLARRSWVSARPLNVSMHASTIKRSSWDCYAPDSKSSWERKAFDRFWNGKRGTVAAPAAQEHADGASQGIIPSKESHRCPKRSLLISQGGTATHAFLQAQCNANQPSVHWRDHCGVENLTAHTRLMKGFSVAKSCAEKDSNLCDAARWVATMTAAYNEHLLNNEPNN